MPIKTTCASCESTYNLPDSASGKTVRCKQCGAAIRVEDAVVLVEEVDEVVAVEEEAVTTKPRSRGKAPAAVQASRGRKRPHDEDEEEEERPAKKVKKKSSALPLILGGVAVVLLMVCGGIGGLGYYLYAKANEAVEVAAKDMTTFPAPAATPAPVREPEVKAPEVKAESKEPEIKIEVPQPKPEPSNLEEALVMLRDTANPQRQGRAAVWLRTTPAEESRRDDVSKALDPLLKDRSNQGSALQALTNWSTKENVPSLLEVLQEPGGSGWAQAMSLLGALKDARAAEPLASQLTAFGRTGQAASALQAFGKGAEMQVLKYLNSPNRDARQAAVNLLRNCGTSDDAILEQTLNDLAATDAQTRRLAAGGLKNRPVNASKQNDVSKALAGLLQDSDGGTKQAAMQGLSTWATKSNAPLIADAVEKDGALRKTGIPLLGTLKDVQAVPTLVKVAISSPRDRPAVRDALKVIGAPAEKAVVQILKTSPLDPKGIEEVVHILGAIGTRTSLPVLTFAKGTAMPSRNPRNPRQVLPGHPAVVRACDQAMLSIQQRGR